MDCEKLLGVATDIAYDLLESGAEIYRVEESIQRIFSAYGAREGSIFAIPTLLILSLEDEEGNPHTAIRRLGNHGSDLARVGAYNDLCRNCRHDCKQSFRAQIVACRKYRSKRSETWR